MTTDRLARGEFPDRLSALETALAEEKAQRAQDKADTAKQLAQVSTVFRNWFFDLEEKNNRTAGRFDDLVEAIATGVDGLARSLREVAERGRFEDLEDARYQVLEAAPDEQDYAAVFGRDTPNYDRGRRA